MIKITKMMKCSPVWVVFICLLVAGKCLAEGGQNGLAPKDTNEDAVLTTIPPSPVQVQGAGIDLPSIIRDLGIERNPYVTLGEWMSETPQVPGASAQRQLEIAHAWATLWVDILPANGHGWTHPIISPGESYRAGIWLWDSGFHVLGLLHGGPKARQLAIWQVEVILSNQWPSGKVPSLIVAGGGINPNPDDHPSDYYGIQYPGILPFAVNRLYDTVQSDEERKSLGKAIETFYPKLVLNHDWFMKHLDQGRGLCRSVLLDSWDNSPRWDHKEQLKETIDLDCWLYLDLVELRTMATILGKTEEAQKLGTQADELKKLIGRYHWSEKLGCFNDTLTDGSVSGVITPAIFWPLWTGIATPDQAKRTLTFLQDPKELGTPWPIPCVASSDKAYHSHSFWRGSTWVNLNWVAIRGLQRYGFTTEARALREKTLAMVARNPIPNELYDSQTGEGKGSRYYGWTAALFIDLAFDKD